MPSLRHKRVLDLCVPHRGEREVACRRPILPMLRGLGLEDSLQVPALIAVDPKLLQQPLPEVRLERGQRHVALPCAVQPVARKTAAGRSEPLAQWLGKRPRCLREGHLLIPRALPPLPGEQQREGRTRAATRTRGSSGGASVPKRVW